MWLLLNNAYLSIVEHKEMPRHLLVRSRIEGDIERAIPTAQVYEMESADYRYRADVPREILKEALGKAVDGIDYGNFKAR